MNNPSAKWSDDFFLAMRQKGDEPADRAIQQIFSEGKTGEVNDLLISLTRNADLRSAALPPRIREYLEANARPPEAELPRALEAQKLFIAHGNLALVVLLCASLPECYTMKKGMQVLWLTQRLQEHVLRRLVETAQMVIAVMAPGGLDAGGAGVATAAKVRLMHAAIRSLILHKGPARQTSAPPRNFAEVLISVDWDEKEWGYPINQMDLAFTLLTFSYVIPRGMEKLGVAITKEQKDAFIHCWNIVGTLMGIVPELLAADYDEAGWLFNRIKELEGGPSEAGQTTTAALVGCLREALPGHLLDFLPELVIRELVGDQTADWLGLKHPSRLGELAGKALIKEIRLGAWIKRAAHNQLILTPKLWSHVAGSLLNYLLNFKQPPGWNRGLFRIPDDLAAAWKIPRPNA